MTADKVNRYWALAAILLIAITIAGGIVAWLRYSPSPPVEISLPPSPELEGEVYVVGAVNSPGLYPLEAGDSIEALVQGAGGTTSDADLNELKLYIPREGEAGEPQRIDINRAEVWLLKALPGIGETLAQRIVDYRRQNGAFHSTNELLQVSGIGTAIYEQIKDLITVAD